MGTESRKESNLVREREKLEKREQREKGTRGLDFQQNISQQEIQ